MAPSPFFAAALIVDQATAQTVSVSCPDCEIPGRSGFVFHISHSSKALSGFMVDPRTSHLCRFLWLKSVQILRPRRTPFAGNVFEVGPLSCGRAVFRSTDGRLC